MTTLTYPEHQTEDRWQTILDLWRGNQWLYALVGFFAGILTFPVVSLLVNDALNLLGGIVPEAIGIAFTVFIIERYNRRRDERKGEDSEKQRLVRNAGSQSNDTALAAVNELRKLNWLEGKDGLLQKADLVGANLKNALLYRANLSEVNLWDANLSSTSLRFANLEYANLRFADLSYAKLSNANLTRAVLLATNLSYANLEFVDLSYAKLFQTDLSYADLSDADLYGAELFAASLFGALLAGANLRSVTLHHTNIEKANFYNAYFNEYTILPDGTNWTPDTDWTKFGAVMLPPEDWERYQRGWRPDESAGE